MKITMEQVTIQIPDRPEPPCHEADPGGKAVAYIPGERWGEAGGGVARPPERFAGSGADVADPKRIGLRQDGDQAVSFAGRISGKL